MASCTLTHFVLSMNVLKSTTLFVWKRLMDPPQRHTSDPHPTLLIILRCILDDPFPKILFGTIGFQLGDGIRCLESEAQNTELSLEVAKIQFSLSGL